MLEGRSCAVWDLEIKKEIKDIKAGWHGYDEMGISCMAVFDYKTMRTRIFDSKSMEAGVDLLRNRKLLVGFNTVGFDSKVLRVDFPSFPEPDTVSVAPLGHYDILREIWIALRLDPDNFNPRTHGGFKLDDVANDTLGVKKSGNGELAPVLYKAGRFAELHDYCIDDTRIERMLFEFIMKYGYVFRGTKKISVRIPG